MMTMTLIDSLINVGAGKPRVEIYYDDVNYFQYVCDADTGSALSDKAWHITRITSDSNKKTLRVMTANGGNYDNAATDIATVAGYTYN